MCLITEQKRAKRTKEDLIVYKFGDFKNGAFITSTRSFCYKFDRLYQTQMKRITDPFTFNIFDVEVALFYRDNVIQTYNAIIQSVKRRIKSKQLICINEGFHSAKKESRYGKIITDKIYNNKLQITKCTIPKDSLYYEDRTGLIVSNQIIIHKP